MQKISQRGISEGVATSLLLPVRCEAGGLCGPTAAVLSLIVESGASVSVQLVQPCCRSCARTTIFYWPNEVQSRHKGVDQRSGPSRVGGGWVGHLGVTARASLSQHLVSSFNADNVVCGGGGDRDAGFAKPQQHCEPCHQREKNASTAGGLPGKQHRHDDDAAKMPCRRCPHGRCGRTASRRRVQAQRDIVNWGLS